MSEYIMANPLPVFQNDATTNRRFLIGGPAPDDLLESGPVTMRLANELRQCLETARSGDAIFITNGEYLLSPPNPAASRRARFHDVDVQIIGIGDNVKIKIANYYYLSLTGNSKVLFRNVNVEFDRRINIRGSGISLCDKSSVQIEDCKFTSRGSNKPLTLIASRSKGVSMFMHNSCFLFHEGVCIFNEKGSVTLVDCTFRFLSNSSGAAVWANILTCVGNIFDGRGTAFGGHRGNNFICLGNIFSRRDPCLTKEEEVNQIDIL